MTSPLQYFSPGTNGEIGVGTSQVQGPNIKCKMAIFFADPGNTGVVHLGLSTGVTASDGSTDTTTGIALSAGRDSGWIPFKNLQDAYLIADAASQSVTYMTVT
jgi:hypothetical protein